MKSLKFYLTSFFITFLCLGTVNAQTQGLGKRLAQDVIAYVSYIELGNIGSKDADCKGANFLTGNVNTIVDKEIIPLLKQIQKKDKKSKNDGVSQYSKQLKNLRFQKNRDGTFVLSQIYDQKKREAVSVYGIRQGCVAIAVAFRTVVQQKMLSIRDISNQLL